MSNDKWLPSSWSAFQTTAFQSTMWPVDNNFILPGIITSLCLDRGSAHMGICCCRPNCMELIEPLRLALTVSDVCLKFGCFQYSALELSHFVCYINSWLTYLLIQWVINNEANETHGDAYAVIRYFLMWRMWWQKVKIGTYTIGIK